jgi:cobyrinic acid a,c-diamide synthase
VEIFSVPRLLISSLTRGSGKSLLMLGLTHELRRRGISVSCAVVGPSLVQAVLLRRLSGRYVRSLDERILTSGQALSAVYQLGVGSDFLLIEGAAGLFEGSSAGSLRGSDGEIAALTHTPVALVVDVRGFEAGVAALVRGAAALAHGYEVVGSILNRVGVQTRLDAGFYSQAFRSLGVAAPFGILPETPACAEVPAGMIRDTPYLPGLSRQFFVACGDLVKEHVNIDELVACAQNVVGIRMPDFDSQPSARRCRIAVSDDAIFNVCYQDNLDLLRFYGAEIVPFSPLADIGLPRRIGAVYMTGANLAYYAAELSANDSMRDSLREFALRGGVIYSEGSGTAYLSAQFGFAEDGPVHQGAGVIPGVCRMTGTEFSYCEANSLEDSVIGRSGLIVKGIQHERWEYADRAQALRLLRVERPGGGFALEGYSPSAQTLCSFCFLHFGSNVEIARNLVEAAEVAQNAG